MKLAILGGGGFRVPLVYEAIATGTTELTVDEIVLYDVDPDRLLTINKVIIDMGERLVANGRAKAPPRVVTTMDLSQAVTSADFVFSAVRVGGAKARIVDERVALDLGLLGQETVGAGGLAYALRTIPVALRIARMIADRAPKAWVINFTNPAGIVTEAMRDFLGDRVVGICDTPIGLVRRVGRILGVDPIAGEGGVGIDYVGLNHLGWLRSISVDGEDRLSGLLADDDTLDQIEEARLVGKDWVRADGALPNEYLYYYLHTDKAMARVRAAGSTRGEFLEQQQGKFYKTSANCCRSPFEFWRAFLHEREATYMAESRDEERREEDVAGGGYQEVALRLMTAIARGKKERMILDVGNDAKSRRSNADGKHPEKQLVVPELPADTVIEVPCIVDDNGVHPEPVKTVELPRLGLMATVRGSERRILEAALTGSKEAAWHGFAMHPLVNSAGLGRRLLKGYMNHYGTALLSQNTN